MKNILIILTILVTAFGCQQKTEQTSEAENTAEPTEVTTTFAHFGEKINDDGIMPMESFIAALDGKDSLQVKLSGEILASCKMKGCWMKVGLDDEQEMRVTFKDYDFFIPKDDVKGKETIFEGYAKLVETDVETLKHFAKDAGKSQQEIDQITEPKKEISFVASGVIIK